MKSLILACLVCSSLSAQTPPPGGAAPNQVIGKVDGHDMTLEEGKKIATLAAVGPPQFLQGLSSNPAAVMKAVYIMEYLAGEARKDKLDQQSPLKDQIQFIVDRELMNAYVTMKRNLSQASPDEVDKYYNDHKDQFDEVKLRVIYISFVNDPSAATGGRKTLTEAQAKAKAQDLVKQLHAGADFIKLVKEYSEDETSKAKDGEFGVIHRDDTYPDDIKKPVFALKPGEVTEPIRQANGFYIFQCADKSTQPLADVRTKLFQQLGQAKFNEWFGTIQKRFEVTLDKPDVLRDALKK